jgi:hypothetical protein
VRVIRLLVCFLSLVSIASAQMAKTSVSVRQTGNDTVGPLLKQAVQDEIKKLGYPDAHQANNGFRYFIELITLDTAETKDGGSSFVSVVISSMTPGGWPTPDQWYHKVILVNRAEVPQIAARIIKDMNASWCNVIKSSLTPCPAEEPWPGVPQTPDNRPVQRPQVAPTR